jgi:hypothetical protein
MASEVLHSDSSFVTGRKVDLFEARLEALLGATDVSGPLDLNCQISGDEKRCTDVADSPVNGQLSDAEGDSGDEGAFECHVSESGLLQAKICACAVICDEVCDDIAYENGGVQASMILIETVANGQSVVIGDAVTLVEAVAYQFPEKPAPKAPDKWAIVLRSDGGCIGSGSAWGRDSFTEAEAVSPHELVSVADCWDVNVPSQTKKHSPDKLLGSECGWFASGFARAHLSLGVDYVAQAQMSQVQSSHRKAVRKRSSWLSREGC